jgi:hypothetical protein
MNRTKMKNDLSRKVFTHTVNDCWQCLDYKTFYMTIRPTNLETDKMKGYDPNHYMLSPNFCESVLCKSLPEAFTRGYDMADEEYELRYPGLKNVI